MKNTAMYSAVECAAMWLTIIGGLNWGLVGAFEFNLVTMVAGLFGGAAGTVETAVYVVVGLAALQQGAKKAMHCCGGGS